MMLAIPVAMLAQNPKAEKLLSKADLYYQANDKLRSQELYLEVLELDESNYRASYQLGKINRFFKNYREASRYFRKASEIDPNKDPSIWLEIGLTYKILGNYRKAKEAFEDFKKRNKDPESEEYKRAELEIAGCELAESLINKKPNWRVKSASFNSAAGDRFPAYLDQRQEDVFLAFSSSRPLPNKRNKRNSVTGEPKDEDIYFVIKENDTTFSADVERINYKKINTKTNNGPASFTGDGLTMYFTICNTKQNRDGCSIYESKYDPVKKRWGKPSFLEGINGEKTVIVNAKGKTKEAPTDDRQPFITRDGRTLFFVSDRPGGEGAFDIWYSRRVGAGWSAPENLGANINSPYNEYSPYFNEAGNALYFSSDGHPSLGGTDLFKSAGSIGNWSEPENMGIPLNSSYDDFGGIWMDEDSLAYFSSDRPGGNGSYDVYWGMAIPVDLSKLNVAVKGVIRDKRTKDPIPFATATLYEFEKDGSITELGTFNTTEDARYEFKLKVDRKYKVLGNAREYLANEEEFDTQDIREDRTIIKNIDIELEPIIIDSAIYLDNIYYDFDKYYLRPDAISELQKLITLLNQNQNIIVQMGSHTDTNGSDPYNDNLSDNRAKAVVAFLVDNGINPQRLSWFGYGEREPLIFPELSDEDEQTNRRTELKIKSIDFE
ncbi:MAG: OmpA family protein [Bacteroidia bacterium]|nr:OmpA family protein [Bacteroidia bacterium]